MTTVELDLRLARLVIGATTRIKSELERLPLAVRKLVLERVVVDVLDELDEPVARECDAATLRRRGRPPKYGRKDTERVLTLSSKGMSERKIMQMLGIPHASVGRIIKQGKL